MDPSQVKTEPPVTPAPDQPASSNALESLSQTETTDNSIFTIEDTPTSAEPTPSRLGRLKAVFNIYLLLFILLIVIVGIVFVISYLNSQKMSQQQAAGVKDLTQQQLSEIASGDANVGDPRYVLNVQSDAVFAGSALVRGNLNVAGGLQLGQGLNVSDLTVSGRSNFNDVQVNSLAVAGSSVLQGSAAVQGQLSVGGAGNFGGAVTAPQITTGNLTITGSGLLTINSHISFRGGIPGSGATGAAGGGATSSVSGSDTSGTITINTGGGTSAGCLANLSFTQRFIGTPHVILTPIGASAAQTRHYAERSSGGFSVCSITAPPAGQSLTFDYFVTN